MKKYIGLIFTLLFPYIFAAGTCGILIFSEPLFKIFGEIVTPFLAFFALLVAVGVISFVINVVIIITAVRRQWDAHELAKINMIIKLVQIPSYVAIFIAGGIYAIGLFHAALLAIIIFTAVDSFSVFLSGSIGAVATWRGHKENLIDKKAMIVLGISQFIFCIDIIGAIVLFVKTKMKK